MASTGVELMTAWVRLVPTFQDVTENTAKAFAPAQKAAEKEGEKAGTGFSKRAKVAMAAGAIGAGAIAAFKGLYSVGEIFDDVTDTIRTGTGAQGKALDSLVASAKNVGSKVPASFDKIGPTIADLNTRFGMTGKTVETVASQYLEAGRILGEDVNIGKTSAAFSAFKIEGDAVSGAMDTLFQVSQATGVGMNDLASGAQAVAPALQTLGFSFEDSISLIGSLDKAGMNSTAVMASMSKGMVTLAKDGEEPADAFKRVVGELEGFVSAGDSAAALDLASQVFGTRGASQFIGALESGTLKMSDLMEATGATGDTILGVGEETMDFAEQWQIVMNDAMVAIEPLASAVFAAIGDGLKAAMPFLKDLGAWVSENTSSVGIIAGVVGVTLVAAFLSWAASAWAVTAAMLANPITWIVLGIVALIAAIVALVMNWDHVVAFVTEIWSGFMSWMSEVMDGFVTWWGELWAGISKFFTDIWENIKSFFASATKWVVNTAKSWGASISTWWNGLWSGIGNFFKGIWDGIKSAFTLATSWVINTARSWGASISNWWNSLWTGVSNLFTRIWDGVKNTFQTLMDWFKTKPVQAFEAARDAIGKAWEGIQELAKKPVKFVVNTVINGLIDTINLIPGVNLSKVSLPKGFATGGILPGMSRMANGDDQLIMARQGEGVMVSEALRTGADRSAFMSMVEAGRRGVGIASMLSGFARGGLVDPLPKGSYSVSQPYHSGHNGIDLAAASGTKIYAAADGLVGMAGFMPMGGNEVYVQHANGLGTRYSHMSRFATSKGSMVKQGQVIGYVGSTGMSTGPHLHYMVHNPGTGAMGYGNHQNPAGYMGLQGKDLGEAAGSKSILDGLIDFATSKVKGAFPEGGMWVDAAGGLVKEAAGRMAKVFNPFAAADGHTKPALYDDGGLLPPGLSLVNNKTGRPEPVFTGNQYDALLDSVAAGSGRGDGKTVVELYDSNGQLFGAFDGRIRKALSAAVPRRLNDALGVR